MSSTLTTSAGLAGGTDLRGGTDMVSFLPILSEEVLVVKLVLGDLCCRGCGSESDCVGAGRLEATSHACPLIPKSRNLFRRALVADGARPRSASSLPEGKKSSAGSLADA